MFRRTLIAAVLCLAFAAPAMAQGKIGYAELMALGMSSVPGQERQKQLEGTFGNELKQLETQRDAMAKMVEDFQRQAGALSENARNARAQEIQTKGQEFEAKFGDYNLRVQAAQENLGLQLEDIVRQATHEFATKNGYDVILDSTLAIYLVPSQDLTAQLIEEVNRVWKDRGGKFNPAPASR